MNRDKKSSSGIAILIILAVILMLKGSIPVVIMKLLAAGILLFLIAVGLIIWAVVWAVSQGTKTAPVKNRKYTRPSSGDPEEIRTAKGQMAKADQLISRILDKEVRLSARAVYEKAGKIIAALCEKPGEISKAGQFFRYYLPTFVSILEKYSSLENNGVIAADLKKDIKESLAEMTSALQKQYENLFSGEILDLTVEMKTLDQILKRDGLL